MQTHGESIIFAVEDNGVGIATEHHARIFERFFRTDYGRNKKVGGTGLGLSIVKHIVSTYGGTITLQSKKNVGTKIEVTFPKTRAQR